MVSVMFYGMVVGMTFGHVLRAIFTKRCAAFCRLRLEDWLESFSGSIICTSHFSPFLEPFPQGIRTSLEAKSPMSHLISTPFKPIWSLFQA